MAIAKDQTGIWPVRAIPGMVRRDYGPGMSPRLVKALGGVTVTAVLTTLLGVAPVPARQPEARPVGHFDSKVKVGVPAGGTVTAGSPTVPKDMKKAGVEVGAPLSDNPAFKSLALTLVQLPKPGQRVTACLTLAGRVVGRTQDERIELGQAKGTASTQALATIYYCLRMAQLVAEYLAENPPQQRVPASGCGVMPLAAPTKVEKVDGQFVVSSDGEVTSKPANSRLKVTCVVKNGKYLMAIQPKKKKASLKSIVGKRLTIGLASPSSAEDGADVTVKFKAP